MCWHKLIFFFVIIQPLGTGLPAFLILKTNLFSPLKWKILIYVNRLTLHVWKQPKLQNIPIFPCICIYINCKNFFNTSFQFSNTTRFTILRENLNPIKRRYLLAHGIPKPVHFRSAYQEGPTTMFSGTLLFVCFLAFVFSH